MIHTATKLRPSLAALFHCAAEYTEKCDAGMAYYESMRMRVHNDDIGLLEDAESFARRYWWFDSHVAPTVSLTRDERVLFFGFLAAIAAYEGV